MRNAVYNDILITSSLYSNDKRSNNTSNINSNTPKRPENSSSNKSAKLRKFLKKSMIDGKSNNNDNNNDINNDNENNNENDKGYNNNNTTDLDNNIASGYVALGESIEFVIGGNQPPTVARVVTKDIRSPSHRSFHKRQTELIAEATIEANKGKIKNANVIHKVYDMTKTMKGINIAKELAKRAKSQEVVEEDFNKVVLLIETERLMHLYFAKKFLQLDLMIDPVLTIYDALEAIKVMNVIINSTCIL